MGTNYSQDRRSNNNSSPAANDAEMPSYALSLTRGDNEWLVTRLPAECLDLFDVLVEKLRSQRAEGPLFGILNYGCEFFVIARPSPRGTKIFVSDLDAALDQETIIAALEERGYDTDLDEDWEGSWGVGDFSILEDLGIPESVLSVIVDDDEAWADDQITEIAETLGCEAELERAVADVA